MDARLLKILEAGGTVVTATARLARHVRLEHARRQRAREEGAWPTPDVLSWDGFVSRLGGRAGWRSNTPDARIPLNAAQEHTLWADIICRSGAGDGLLDVAGTARLAREAWSIIQRHRLPDPARAEFATEEVRAFAGWMREYHARCQAAGWLDAARLADAVSVRIEETGCDVPERLLLLGFERLTPQQRRLMRAVEQRGCRIASMRGPRKRLGPKRVVFHARDDELLGAARWGRNLLAAEEVRCVGIVVPRLAERRLAVMRMLDQALVPGAELPGATATGRPYNLSAGPPLSDYPVVRSAMTLMRLAAGRLAMDEMTRLLRSPFIAGGTTEMARRAQFDAWLRMQGLVSVRLDSLGPLLDAFARRSLDALVLARCCREAGQVLLDPQEVLPADAWALRFMNVLKVFGWPGERSLDSAEYQTVVAFRAALGRLASLGTVGGPVNARAATASLVRILDAEPFQPETPDVPIQVLGLEDAYGFDFDHLWVTGLDDETWPAPPRLNPFIPAIWQREHELPHASSELALNHARRYMMRLLCASDSVVLSHAARDGDRELSASPLISHVPEVGHDAVALADLTDARGALLRSVGLETLEDEHAPPLEATEAVGGGARLLALQAACPFRAFAEIRLGASLLGEPTEDLDASERGVLVHSALEVLWDEVEDSQALAALASSDRLDSVIRRAASVALGRFEGTRFAPVSPPRRRVEQTRLEGLLREWLTLELERGPFEVIGTEVGAAVRMGPINLGMRVDRVDRIAGVGSAIIDYKTGAQGAVAQWLGPRPDEPQLPLYAITADEPPQALLLARLRRGDMRFVGVAREADVVPGIGAFDESRAARVNSLDWDGLMEGWRASLGALASQFAAGHVPVDPKYGPTSCRRCHLGAFCRIGELRTMAETSDDRFG